MEAEQSQYEFRLDLTLEYECRSCHRPFRPTEDQIIDSTWRHICFACWAFSDDVEESKIDW